MMLKIAAVRNSAVAAVSTLLGDLEALADEGAGRTSRRRGRRRIPNKKEEKNRHENGAQAASPQQREHPVEQIQLEPLKQSARKPIPVVNATTKSPARSGRWNPQSPLPGSRPRYAIGKTADKEAD